MTAPTEASERYAVIAIACGVAPILLAVRSMVPLVGCIATPLTLLAILGAIGFGLAGYGFGSAVR